ncbi:hypothetical protein HK103_001623 [Boothiomyces macroporosus]|uniref:alpha-galactosidase n=1 Tax=Boothiomyces macroporosus TaxID=261099 RepID=A0AAD5UA62_9FUNG|nr:hypothetical protein HK103_001623 [Boothiomyces macroporosus]
MFYLFGLVSSYWKPTAGTTWQIQLKDCANVNTSYSVAAYDIDLFDTPDSTFSLLKSRGTKIICYFSAGSFENWRADAGNFTSDMYGNGLNGWPGEFWLDTTNSKVRNIMVNRMQYAQQRGCDAVDPDNVDGYNQQTGFSLTYQTQLDYNTFLANTAHDLGMGVGLKNDLGQITDLVNVFDFQVNEQCFQMGECNKLLPFINANKPVFGIEYQGDPSAVCPTANQDNFSTLFKGLDLTGPSTQCFGPYSKAATPTSGSVEKFFSLYLLCLAFL